MLRKMMRQIGDRAPRFRVPALANGHLSDYFDSVLFRGRWVALSFLPYVGVIDITFFNRQAETFKQIDTVLLIVNSGSRPLHRLWIGCAEKPRIALLADPLGRLHRSFGITAIPPHAKCRTFLIDSEGILRLHVSHDFNEAGLSALREVIASSRTRSHKDGA